MVRIKIVPLFVSFSVMFICACSGALDILYRQNANIRMPFVALDNQGKLVRNWNVSMEVYESRGLLQGGDQRVTINQVVDSVLWVDVSNAKIVTIQGQKQGFIGEHAKVAFPELYRLYKMGNPAVRLADTTKEKEKKVALVANFTGTPFQLIMLKKPRAPLMMYERYLHHIETDYWKITDSGGWCQARVNPKYRLCKTFQIDSIGGHGIENYRLCKDSNLVLNWKPTKDTVYVKAPPGYQAIHMTSVYPYDEFYVFPIGMPRMDVAFQGTRQSGGGGENTNAFWFVSKTKDEHFRVRWAYGTEIKGSMPFKCYATRPYSLPAYGVDSLSFQMEDWKLAQFTGTIALYTKRQLKRDYGSRDCLRDTSEYVKRNCHTIPADLMYYWARKAKYDLPEFHGPDSARYLNLKGRNGED